MLSSMRRSPWTLYTSSVLQAATFVLQAALLPQVGSIISDVVAVVLLATLVILITRGRTWAGWVLLVLESLNLLSDLPPLLGWLAVDLPRPILMADLVVSLLVIGAILSYRPEQSADGGVQRSC
jgi:hypothetical protein